MSTWWEESCIWTEKKTTAKVSKRFQQPSVEDFNPGSLQNPKLSRWFPDALECVLLMSSMCWGVSVKHANGNCCDGLLLSVCLSPKRAGKASAARSGVASSQGGRIVRQPLEHLLCSIWVLCERSHPRSFSHEVTWAQTHKVTLMCSIALFVCFQCVCALVFSPRRHWCVCPLWSQGSIREQTVCNDTNLSIMINNDRFICSSLKGKLCSHALNLGWGHCLNTWCWARFAPERLWTWCRLIIIMHD